MDQIKLRILDLLSGDCRVPVEQIATMLGISAEQVVTVIAELEKERVILRYSPIIDWDRTTRQRVEGMIEVKVIPQRDRGFDAVAKRISGFQEVKSVYLMSGDHDLLVLVEAPTLKDLALFVSEKLSTLEAVQGTSTSFVLKRYKQDGAAFGGSPDDRRLVVSP